MTGQVPPGMRLRILIFALFRSLITVDGVANPSELAALQDLYSFLNSPPQLTGWNAGGDPCQQWRGVECSDTGVVNLRLSNMALSGLMSFQLDRMQALAILDMSGNVIGGQVPYALPPNVQQINLSGNNLTGPIPYSISQLRNLTDLNLSHNQLQGQLPDIFALLSSLRSLDLSYNVLTSDLPQSIQFLNATSVYLQNNQLTGSIELLAGVPLQNLNVMNNHFSGWIPQSLNGLVSLNDGNSWRTDTAPPPPPGTPPLDNGGSPVGPNTGQSARPNGDKKSGVSSGGVAGIVLSLLVVGAALSFFVVKRHKHRSSSDVEKLTDNHPFAQDTSSLRPPAAAATAAWKMNGPAMLMPPPVTRNKSEVIVTGNGAGAEITVQARRYSVADLQVATGSFGPDNIIGDGSLGRVYRARFGNGKAVAVKKLNLPASVMPGTFMAAVSAMEKLRHPNIAELDGYCCEHGLHLLVYHLYPDGSLRDVLRDRSLEWGSRVRIALGAARALEYLHELCSPPVVHGNVTSVNILVDAETNPRVSGCGLADLGSAQERKADGYGPPELDMSGHYFLKSDVYGFGVVMLELLTGREPLDASRPRNEQSLVRWAAPQLHDIDALSKMVDPTLHGLYPIKSLSRFADIVALCVQPEPEFRPPMSEVVQSLLQLVQRSDMSK